MTARVPSTAPTPAVLRKPARDGAAALHDLIALCPPLDLNSRYAYLLLCEHHADTCVVAELDGRLVGAVTAYFVPAHSDVLFIWQVAVTPGMQGQRLASSMLDRLIKRCAVERPLRIVQATISPSNIASRRLFTSLATRHGLDIDSSLLFSVADFGDGGHDEE